jgi:hypothetical protein
MMKDGSRKDEAKRQANQKGEHKSPNVDRTSPVQNCQCRKKRRRRNEGFDSFSHPIVLASRKPSYRVEREAPG